MAAYYNEIDPYAAQWLRNLIQAGHIAEGIVDERSIEDVKPSDLSGFTQVHFFAGIGVWSYALRNAGWPDDRPVWTGSCPCQPFSAAGAGAGFADERHLWPAFFHLIEQCKPATVFGEQVASKDAEPWLDLVQTDLEAVGYGVGAVAFPSAGVGAPHIRDRLYWVADTSCERVRAEGLGAAGAAAQRMRGADGQRERVWVDSRAGSTSDAYGLADSKSERWAGQLLRARAGVPEDGTAQDGHSCGMADAEHNGCSGSQGDTPQSHSDWTHIGLSDRRHIALKGQPATSPTNGFWRNADWLLCRDGRWRPVEPGTFPLAHGASARVGRLRAYGNAINAKAAQAFIESFVES